MKFKIANFFQNEKYLKITYLAIQGSFLLLIIFLPGLINSSLVISKDLVIEEGVVEGTMIAILIILSFFIFGVYDQKLAESARKVRVLEKDKTGLEDRVNEALNYIGQVNVQIQEIKSVFSSLKKYPESKEDFKEILEFLAQKVLGIVNVDWVLLRIVEPATLKTLREQAGSRGSAVLLKYNISNKALVEKGNIDDCVVVRSDQENLKIKAFCVLPTKKLSGDQEILVKAIVNQAEMLFLIFTSEYYKENHLERRH